MKNLALLLAVCTTMSGLRNPEQALQCPTLSCAGLETLLATRKRAKLVFFASWCSNCKDHLRQHYRDPEAIFIATFDEPQSAAKAASRLGVVKNCFTEDGIAKHFQVTKLPKLILWQDGKFGPYVD